MNLVPNADEFLLKARRIRREYKEHFGPRIAQVRARYADTRLGATPDGVEAGLEFHARCYVVNGLLAALNWRLDASPEDGLPPLVGEAPIRSSSSGRIRFLDYFGVERETLRPLLVVETKRPSSSLPRLLAVEPTPSQEEPRSVIVRGLAGEQLSGDWSDWLNDLTDYVRSVQGESGHVPRRLVITNGEWLVIFLSPDDAFLGKAPPDPEQVLVFGDWDEVEINFALVFRELEQSRVLRRSHRLTIGDLGFYVAGENVDRMMHGLRVRYVERPGVYARWPVIAVAPVLHLRSLFGVWLQVENPGREYALPESAGDLADHIMVVRAGAMALLQEASELLGVCLEPVSLVDHYESDDFDVVRGVTEVEEDGFVLATGTATHYLLPEPTVVSCPFHSWSYCREEGVESNPGPIERQSIEPRVFFVNESLHHCAHQRVKAAKANAITEENRRRCGSRSGLDGQAFCEVWRFETHLCCRTCAFQEVCTKAEVFVLPCRPE